MERLTKRDAFGWISHDCEEHFDEQPDGTALSFCIGEAIDRLAAYEDTGMAPKEVKLIANALREVGETYNCWFNYVAQCVIEHNKLQELAQAEKDGRLVVHGKWMPTDYMVPYGRCSVCQHESKADDYGYVSPYCPWCGAKMETDNEAD